MSSSRPQSSRRQFLTGAGSAATALSLPILDFDFSDWLSELLGVEAESTSTSTSSTTRKPYARNTYVASEYGDDGAAIQAALDEAGNNPSYVIVDPTGNGPYVGDAIGIPSHTWIDLYADISAPDGTSRNVLETKDAYRQKDTAGTIQEDITVRAHGGATIDGNKANATPKDGPSGTDGFDACGIVVYATGVTLDGLSIRNGAIHNLMVAGQSEDVTVRNCRFENPKFSNCHAHFIGNIDDNIPLSAVRDLTIQNIETVGGDATGSLRLAGVKEFKIDGAYIRDHTADSSAHGLRLYMGDDAVGINGVAKGVTVENVNGDGIVVDTSSKATRGSPVGPIVVTDSTVEGAGGDGVRIETPGDNVDSLVLGQLTIEDCTSYGLDVSSATINQGSVTGFVQAGNGTNGVNGTLGLATAGNSPTL